MHKIQKKKLDEFIIILIDEILWCHHLHGDV